MHAGQGQGARACSRSSRFPRLLTLHPRQVTFCLSAKKPLGCPASAKNCSIVDVADMLAGGPKRIYQATRMKCRGCHLVGAYKAGRNLIALKGFEVRLPLKRPNIEA